MTRTGGVIGMIVIAGALAAAGMRAADTLDRDDIGATPLMRAAALSTPNRVRELLDGGADPNLTTNAGATPLMWATGDATKVRLLLDRGAAVNAATKDGDTALVTAARRGNVESMRLLIAHGADPNAGARLKAELLTIAYNDHPAVRQLLSDAGLQLKDLGRSGTPTLGNYPVSNPDAVRALLEMGANPNPRGRFPLLSQAAFQGRLDTVRVLLDHGGDPNARGQQDATPLMMAAAAPQPDPTLVRLLIDYGADIGARDRAGRNAVDWALTQGDTDVAPPAAGRRIGHGHVDDPNATSAVPFAARRRRSRAGALAANRTGAVRAEEMHCVPSADAAAHGHVSCGCSWHRDRSRGSN